MQDASMKVSRLHTALRRLSKHADEMNIVYKGRRIKVLPLHKKSQLDDVFTSDEIAEIWDTGLDQLGARL